MHVARSKPIYIVTFELVLYFSQLQVVLGRVKLY